MEEKKENKRTVLVTGSSRGIGKATALAFGGNGDRVVVHYLEREKEAAQVVSTIEQAGGTAMMVQADIRQEDEVEWMFSAIREKFGEVDVLVNNAGISAIGLFTDLTLADWQQMMDVNVTGLFLCCQQAIPHMVRQKQGEIINLSSMWGLVGASCEVHYSASKAAIIGFTKALAKELAPSNIRVNCVAPGVVATEMVTALGPETITAIRAETPLGYIAQPQEIAQTILFLAGRGGSFYTGQVFSPNGGYVI